MEGDAILFRQLFDARSSTYTYLLADPDTREAVLVDPVFEQFPRDAALLRELGLRLVFVLETHVHADHVTAAWLHREQSGCRIAVGRGGGTTGHDLLLSDGDRVPFGRRHLEVRATPGHTGACLTFVLDDRSLALTGDALLVRGAGRTDFQSGDARTLYRSVRDRIFTLPDDTQLLPAHDYAGRTSTTVGEEKTFNPRLGGARSEDDFAGYMANLALPPPRSMDVAIPANRVCGRPSETARPEAGPSAGAAAGTPARWAPAARTYAGVPEIPVAWLAEHRREVHLVDVREPAEFDGELGHIEGAELVPLSSLRGALTPWPREAPVVVICRSGGRSAQGALILEGAGFTRVANLTGGMIAWRGAGLPVAPH